MVAQSNDAMLLAVYGEKDDMVCMVTTPNQSLPTSRATAIAPAHFVDARRIGLSTLYTISRECQAMTRKNSTTGPLWKKRCERAVR